MSTSRPRTAPARTPALLTERSPDRGTSADPCCVQPRKPRLGSADAVRLSDRLKALGDPTRLRILSQLLAAREPICACDIGAGFDLGQPTISHHLRILREARLARARRRGTWIYYRPDVDALTEVREALANL